MPIISVETEKSKQYAAEFEKEQERVINRIKQLDVNSTSEMYGDLFFAVGGLMNISKLHKSMLSVKLV